MKMRIKIFFSSIILTFLLLFILMPSIPAYALTIGEPWTKDLSEIYACDASLFQDGNIGFQLTSGDPSKASITLYGQPLGFSGNTSCEEDGTVIFSVTSPGTYVLVINCECTGTGTRTFTITFTGGNCTMTFNAEGGTGDSTSTVSSGNNVSEPTAPTRTGYKFEGWYDGAGGTGSKVSFPYKLEADKTVYAKWTANPYIVTYDPGTGTVSPTTQTKRFASTYGKGSDGTADEAMPTPTKIGYKFGGWYTGNDGSGSLIEETTAVTMASDHTLHAKWTIEQYTMTFDAEGGDAVPAKKQDYNTEVTVLTAPTRNGYTFGGWYNGDGGTGSEVSFPYTLIADKTVYAKWTANPYTVTYDPGTGTVSPTTQTKRFGSTYGKNSDGTADEAMPTPTQTGYIFGGWYTGTNGSGSLIEGTTAVATASDHTLHAKWTIEQHTMTFDAEGGNAVPAKTQDYNTQVTVPTAPTRTGYSFEGWYDGDNGTGSEVSFPYTLTADKTVYAKWTANPYTVTYDPGTGTVSPTTQIKRFGSTYGKNSDGTTNEAMPTPTQTGYIFGGWYTGTNGSGSLIEGTTAVTTASDHTLHAKWTIEQHTITFDAEGGNAVSAITRNYNTEIIKPADPTKTGYVFEGWYDGDNGTGSIVSFPYTLTADKTVYAKWTANPYTVTYDPGTGTVSPTTQIKQFGSTYGKNSDGTANEAMPTPTQTGYIFGGWYTGTNGSGSLIEGTTAVATASDHTLHAKWTIEQHTMTFDVEGGNAVPAKTQDYNTQVTAPTAPTRTGYSFESWYDGDNGTGSEVSFPYTLTADKTVYAKWTANPYTVTYDPGTGTVSPTTQTKRFDSTYGKGSDGTTNEAMPTPTLTGYIFGGWYTGAGGTGSQITGTTTVATASDHTLHAKWTVEQRTMTFDAEGGNAVAAKTQDYNTQVTVPTAPTRTGYNFEGWYDGDNGTGSEVSFPYTLTADKTVYAKWTANPYTVTYDPGTGTVSPTTQTKRFASTYGKGSDGTTNEAMPTPTQTGYIFGGWYTGAGGTGSQITGTTAVTTASNHTLYAKWTIEQRTMTFDSEGGSAVAAKTQDYNTQVTVPTAPTRTGYTFEGWYDGDNGTGSIVTFPYTLTVNKTVYAKWTPAGAISVTAEAASLTPTTGTDISITLKVKNWIGNVDQNFDGSRNVTISGVEAAPNNSYGSFEGTILTTQASTGGQTVSVTFTDGVATTILKLNKADRQNIVFNIAGVSTPTTNTLILTPIGNTAASMNITREVAAPSSNGVAFATQPVITLKDQFGNICRSDNSTLITAIKSDAGAWILTGTTTITAVNGIATYSNLGATNAFEVSNAQIAYQSTGLTTVSGAAITLPAPAPSPSTNPVVVPKQPGTEMITVDVKQGSTDNTVSKIEIERTTDDTGKTTDKVTFEEAKAVETVDKLKEEGKSLARIVIPEAKEEVAETKVSIPTKALEHLAQGDINLQIETAEAKVDIPNKTLKSIGEDVDKELYFNLVPIKEEAARNEIENRAVFEVGMLKDTSNEQLTIIGNPVTIETNMPSSDADITLPLTGIELPENSEERAALLAQLAVYIEHSDGDKELVQGDIVEYKNGTYGIKFHITKFSIFTIVKTDKVSSSSCDIEKVTTPSKAKFSGKKITASVSAQSSSLTIKVTTSDNATYQLYRDKACKNELKNNKLTLKTGSNTAYIKVTSADKSNSKVYTLVINRKAEPKRVIIVATKYDFSDSLAGGVLAAQLGGEVVETGISDSDAKAMVSYIKKNYGKQDEIYLIGLGQAINKNLEKMLNKKGYKNIIGIGGEDKYETAQKIAERIKMAKKTKVILVNGESEPKDSKMLQAKCAELGYPILYVKTNSLTSYTIAELIKIMPSQIYIYGNSSLVSDKVIEEIVKKVKVKEENIIRIKTKNIK